MKFEEFDVHVGEFVNRMMDTMSSKNKDYSTDQNDAMSNYYDIASFLKVDPKIVWAVLAFKHITAIVTWTQGRELQSELIAHRFMDAANYMVLGAALAKDIEALNAQAKANFGSITVDAAGIPEVVDAFKSANFEIEALKRELNIARAENRTSDAIITEQKEELLELQTQLRGAFDADMDGPKKAGVCEIQTPTISREAWAEAISERQKLVERSHAEAVLMDGQGNTYTSVAQQMAMAGGEWPVAIASSVKDEDPDGKMAIHDVFAELKKYVDDKPVTRAEKSDKARIIGTDSLYEVFNKLEAQSRFAIVRTLELFMRRTDITQSIKLEALVEMYTAGKLQSNLEKYLEIVS